MPRGQHRRRERRPCREGSGTVKRCGRLGRQCRGRGKAAPRRGKSVAADSGPRPRLRRQARRSARAPARLPRALLVDGPFGTGAAAAEYGRFRARGGKADRLTLIKGIGPVNERKLNDHGVFHFDQIAAWTQADVVAAEAYLAFDGRIAREDWIGQAARLAKVRLRLTAAKRGGK